MIIIPAEFREKPIITGEDAKRFIEREKEVNKKVKQNTLIRIIDSVKATMEFEGLEASPEALKIGMMYLNDEITANEAVEMIKGMYKEKGVIENKE